MSNFLIDKKKFPQTSNNSRQNSGEKQILRIMSLKHNKMNPPNSACNNIKSTIKKKKTNNIINNNNYKINGKTNSFGKINDINNKKKNYNNFLIPNVNINIEKNYIKKEINNQKLISNNNSNKNSLDLIHKTLNDMKNKNTEIINNALYTNYIKDQKNNDVKPDNKNSSYKCQTKVKDNKKENMNCYLKDKEYQSENKLEEIKKEEPKNKNKKKILLNNNYFSNLPPSSRQIILNKNKIINNNINNNDNQNKDGEKMKKNIIYKTKLINNNITNEYNKQLVSKENNSLECLNNQTNVNFNKGLLINRKIMTATNSPNHSIQNNNNYNNNHNIISNSNLSKNTKNIKMTKNIKNNCNSSTNNSNNNSKNIIENYIIANLNKNDNSNKNVRKAANKEVISLNENGTYKNKTNTKTSEKNSVVTTISANNTNNSRKKATEKIKKKEKITDKNKIHNYINNNINNEQGQKFMFNPHHNTLKSNNSINKESSRADDRESDLNQNQNENNKVIINNRQKMQKIKKISNKENSNLIINKNTNHDINNNLNLNEYLLNNNDNKEKITNENKSRKENEKEECDLIQKPNNKIKLDKLTEKLINSKFIYKKGNQQIRMNNNNNNAKNPQKEENNKYLNKEKLGQLLINKEKLLEYNKKLNNNINNLNFKIEQKEESNKAGIPKVKIKMAKKSTHNRNMEQNYILNNRTNTSVLSTMKDSNYYNHECEKLSKFIKEYYKQNLCYPKTDLSFYKYGRIIGRGAFGKVNIGLNILTGRIVAIKSFNKKNLSNESAKKKILYETNLMRSLFHPSVTKILETFESEKYMLIIMEYISGGNLQNFVKKRRKLTEKTAKILFRQIIQGIKYIHSRGIVHRDIKLENILLDLNNIIKICDFGVGKLIKPNTILKDQCGTPVYMAPEIIKGNGYQGFPVDIWSAGIALYIMLSGSLPFNKDKEHSLEYNILNNDIKEISDISEEGNNLLKKILEKDPNKRYTANQILEHPWMNNNLNDDDNNDYDYNNEFKNVNKYHLFTNAESILLAKTHIDYRNAQKKDLAENFTIKNLFTIEEKNKKNVDTKSAILAPYNSMLSDYDENEENSNKIINSKCDNKSKSKNKNTTNELLDNFDNELEIKNGLIKFHGKAKEFNMNYELNNNGEIDNGFLINSKNELVSIDDKDIEKEKNIYLIKNNENKSKNTNSQNTKKHRPSSPYRSPPINMNIIKMVNNLGYNEDYVIKCIERNELNHATTIYYLFSNYENVK
jgi:serine/threonine protein kinase